MKHGSLFSGIGGFDLAAEWMGWDNVFHCEWNEFGQKVLKYYWPKAISYADITKTDFTIHRATIDILSGGFPCQPYSAAGKRKGTEDERHLWPEMLRAIGEIQPSWVVGENVPGLVNWSNGLVFEQVQIDLEAKGYEVTPFLLPAAGVNAPHTRDRIWFIAHSESNSRNNEFRNERPQSHTVSEKRPDEYFPFANSNEKRLCDQEQIGQLGRWGHSFDGIGNLWEEFPTQSPVCIGNDGLSGELDGITFSKWRNESIKAGGNAIVPQVALQIFKSIEQYNNLTP